MLLPSTDSEKVRNQIDNVRRVALPSILESLRCGFERRGQHKGSALTDGLPRDVFDARHVLLDTQHRMHPDIAAFSHEHIYGGLALRTPDEMEAERNWSYPEQHAVWHHVSGRYRSRSNSNEKEVRAVIAELEKFDKWAQHNRRQDGQPWEAAVLGFYRDQELEIRKQPTATGRRSTTPRATSTAVGPT